MTHDIQQRLMLEEDWPTTTKLNKQQQQKLKLNEPEGQVLNSENSWQPSP